MISPSGVRPGSSTPPGVYSASGEIAPSILQVNGTQYPNFNFVNAAHWLCLNTCVHYTGINAVILVNHKQDLASFSSGISLVTGMHAAPCWEDHGNRFLIKYILICGYDSRMLSPADCCPPYVPCRPSKPHCSCPRPSPFLPQPLLPAPLQWQWRLG